MASEQQGTQSDLLRLVLGSNKHDTHRGCMSVSVYDTAWVSCVTKNGKDCFPCSLQFVLASQQANGLWPNTGPSCSDLLNSLGALYALLDYERRHASSAHRAQIDLAKTALSKALKDWKLGDTGGVAFEILMPLMLELLEQYGIAFNFPAGPNLLLLKNEKMSLFPLEKLYNRPNSMAHSLEAFFADTGFDYDRLRPHKVNNSMLGSPAATAAYLMRCSVWDDEAEAYLRQVIELGVGKSSGGVPSAFPSNIFDTTWLTTTILSSRTAYENLPADLQARLQEFIDSSIAGEEQCVGFAAGFEPDLDDTARMSLLLNIMGRPGLSIPMQAMFETSTHFKTYAKERDPSFSANCNALRAIASDLSYQPALFVDSMTSIDKIATFLCRKWWDCEDFPVDKWNLSPFYTSMLMAESFLELGKLSDESGHFAFKTSGTMHNIQLALLQCLTRLLQKQTSDGSWGAVGKREETAYAVLTASALCSLHWLSPFVDNIKTAVTRGQQFLSAQRFDGKLEQMWIEKVTFSSQPLAQAYRFAALNVDIEEVSRRNCWLNMTPLSSVSTSEPIERIFENLPILQGSPSWLFRASRIEARLFAMQLESVRDQVCLREGFTTDKYSDWIPNIWTMANNFSQAHRSCRFLFNMMTISFINFQIDEFMESVVMELSSDALQIVKAHITARLELQTSASSMENAPKSNDQEARCRPNKRLKTVGPIERSKGGLEQVIEVLCRYMNYVLSHADIQDAGDNDRYLLRLELRKFLFAHLTQIEDNRALQKLDKERLGKWPLKTPVLYGQPQRSFWDWTHGTGSDHTSCPYSFVLACCWSSSGHRDFFQSTQQKYIASDACHRLAAMCRVYNDYGSLSRDIDEANLNCANFPELWLDVSGQEDAVPKLKEHIFEVAEYERKMLESSITRLEELSERSIRAMLSVFVMVTDMFGQIYVVRDLASQRQI